MLFFSLKSTTVVVVFRLKSTITPHYTTPHHTTPHQPTLRLTTPHHTALHNTTLHHTTLNHTTQAHAADSDMALALNRYLFNAVLPLLTNYSHFFEEAEHASSLLEQTLHTVYKMSKCSSLTKNQRDVVSDFLVALTRLLLWLFVVVSVFFVFRVFLLLLLGCCGWGAVVVVLLLWCCCCCFCGVDACVVCWSFVEVCLWFFVFC